MIILFNEIEIRGIVSLYVAAVAARHQLYQFLDLI